MKLAHIYHNMGVLFQAGKDYGQAVEANKMSLRNNPKDDETRYNLALAQKLLKDQQQNQQNQDQNQDQNKDNQENKQDQKQDQNKQNNDQKKMISNNSNLRSRKRKRMRCRRRMLSSYLIR